MGTPDGSSIHRPGARAYFSDFGSISRHVLLGKEATKSSRRREREESRTPQSVRGGLSLELDFVQRTAKEQKNRKAGIGGTGMSKESAIDPVVESA